MKVVSWKRPVLRQLTIIDRTGNSEWRKMYGDLSEIQTESREQKWVMQQDSDLKHTSFNEVKVLEWKVKVLTVIHAVHVRKPTHIPELELFCTEGKGYVSLSRCAELITKWPSLIFCLICLIVFFRSTFGTCVKIVSYFRTTKEINTTVISMITSEICIPSL